MAKVINLTDLKVQQVVINVEAQNVTILFALADASGRVWETKEATFWRTVPPEVPITDENGVITGYQPNPDTWFKLPDKYLPLLTTLVTDADTALTAKFLV